MYRLSFIILILAVNVGVKAQNYVVDTVGYSYIVDVDTVYSKECKRWYESETKVEVYKVHFTYRNHSKWTNPDSLWKWHLSTEYHKKGMSGRNYEYKEYLYCEPILRLDYK